MIVLHDKLIMFLIFQDFFYNYDKNSCNYRKKQNIAGIIYYPKTPQNN